MKKLMEVISQSFKYKDFKEVERLVQIPNIIVKYMRVNDLTNFNHRLIKI